MIAKGVDISKMTYKESDKLTDEFVEIMINNIPVDSLLDQVDAVMKHTVGYTTREMMDRKEHEEKGGSWK